MAKVTITIEDAPNGNVKITCNPTFETIANMINSGSGGDTAVHGYALAMVRRAREVSQDQGKLKILLPRIGRR